MFRIKPLQITGFLIVIALRATAVSHALESHFGRSPILIMIGPILAAVGAAGLAVWVAKPG